MFLDWPGASVFIVGFVGVGGILVGLLGIVTAKNRTHLRWRVAGPISVIAGCIALFTVAAGQNRSMWAPPLALALGAALLFSEPGSRLATMLVGPGSLLRKPKLCWAALVIASPAVALVWTSTQEKETTFEQFAIQCDAAWRASTLHQGLTDKDRSVRLYAVDSNLFESQKSEELERQFIEKSGVRLGLIRTAPPDPAYNCHGWLFTAGRYWIPHNEDIERILLDDGYHPVAEPAAGDLVIFHQDDGTITHSGMVRAAEHSGLVLVESKWGWAGRFLHPPETQPYASRFRYFRSTRTGHQLHIAEEDSGSPPAQLSILPETWTLPKSRQAR